MIRYVTVCAEAGLGATAVMNGAAMAAVSPARIRPEVRRWGRWLLALYAVLAALVLVPHDEPAAEAPPATDDVDADAHAREVAGQTEVLAELRQARHDHLDVGVQTTTHLG